MTEIKLVTNKSGAELTRWDIETGSFLYNTETDGLSMVADLETIDDLFYGVLDITGNNREQHDVEPMLSDLRDRLVDCGLKGKYLPVDMQETKVTINFSFNEDNQLPKEYLPKEGDVFYHPDSDELIMLVNYETTEARWDLVSLTTGCNMDASDGEVCALVMDEWDKDTVFDDLAIMVRNRVILPVSELGFRYILK